MQDGDFEDFIKKRKYTKYNKNIIRYIYEGKDIPFSEWITYTYPRSKNVFCSINCIKCYQKTRLPTKRLARRVLIKDELCIKCAAESIYTNQHWLAANSEAQKRIQSTPEQKLKNAEGVSRFWKNNPDKKEQVRQKLLDRYKDLSYKERVCKASKQLFALSGMYHFRKKSWIEFESSYELCFLMWAENIANIKWIRKCKFYIPYIYENKPRMYFPDFLISRDGKKIITEIKSIKTPFYNEEKNNAKIIATQEFINSMSYDGYYFIDEAEAEKIGMELRRSARIRLICKRLYAENKLKLNSKKHIEKYLGIKDETKE